jgi:hypothetical protein
MEECTYFWGVNTSWGINTTKSKRPLNQEDNQAPQPTPPRNQNTRRSPRVPKLKELEVGEGSSLAAAKQLEFSLRLEIVIKTSTKNYFTQPLAFRYIEENTGGKAVLPHRGKLFKKINWEEFPEYILHNDLDMRKIDDEVFLNI